MLALIKLRKDFFIRSYSLKLASVVSNLLLPMIFNFGDMGMYYGFVVIQGMLFTLLEGATQYFYVSKTDGLIRVVFIFIVVFDVIFIAYNLLFDDISALDMLLIGSSFLFYPLKFFFLFLFNSNGRMEGFYYELAENLILLFAIALAIVFKLHIEFVICVFFIRSSIYLFSVKSLLNKDALVGVFDRKDYVNFSYPLIISSVINMSIMYLPKYFLVPNEFGKFSFGTRLMNLIGEPMKILLNANFTKYKNDFDIISIAKKTRTTEFWYYLSLGFLAIVSLFFEVFRVNHYYLAPIIVLTEIYAISYFTKKKMIGITRNNGIYNFSYFLVLGLCFINLKDGYWMLGMFVSRITSLLMIKLVDNSRINL